MSFLERLPFALPLIAGIAAPAAAQPPLPELWVGGIQLCRDTVERVETIFDNFTGEPALVVRFRPPVHALLERETRSNVGGRLPIRYGTRIVSEPVVNEPITGGSLQLSPRTNLFAKMRLAAASPCRAAQPAR